jgi:xanthine/uracil/vitamin C permease (AzgA family)
LLILGLNKQLDLQATLMEGARDLARAHDLYEARRDLQAVFIIGLSFAGLTLAGSTMILMRRHGRASRIAAVGLFLLMSFVLLRAASFNRMDAWLAFYLGDLGSGWWLELAGIGVIATSALHFLLDRSRRAMRASHQRRKRP